MRRLRPRPPRCRNRLVALVVGVVPLVVVSQACLEATQSEPRAAAVSGFTRMAAPEPERPGQLCVDFGDVRVCYDDGVARQVPRTLPAGPPPPEGFRCGGAGRARVCDDRARNGGAFDCGTTRCLQLHARMPDAGEWECVEMVGVAFCHSRGAAAGVAPGRRDLGWLCGARHSSVGAEREQICIDTAPDRPRDTRFRRCRYEQRRGATQRSCEPARGPIAGDPCDQSTHCPADTRCQASVCVPGPPNPSCWLDGDCGPGARCALGSCVQAGA